MIRFLVAAPASGSGKTTISCALLRAFCNHGLNPCAFKCGPDYIDPMFHRACLGVESHNLDLFLSEAGHVKALFARACRGRGSGRKIIAEDLLDSVSVSRNYKRYIFAVGLNLGILNISLLLGIVVLDNIIDSVPVILELFLDILYIIVCLCLDIYDLILLYAVCADAACKIIHLI